MMVTNTLLELLFDHVFVMNGWKMSEPARSKKTFENPECQDRDPNLIQIALYKGVETLNFHDSKFTHSNKLFFSFQHSLTAFSLDKR